jgi:hypothetical protein
VETGAGSTSLTAEMVAVPSVPVFPLAARLWDGQAESVLSYIRATQDTHTPNLQFLKQFPEAP